MLPDAQSAACGHPRISPPFSRQRNNSNSSLHSERSHRFSSLNKDRHPTVVRPTRIPSPDRKPRPSTGSRPHVKNIFIQPGDTPPEDDYSHGRNPKPTYAPNLHNIPRKPIPAPPRLDIDEILRAPLPMQPRRLPPTTSHQQRPTSSHARRPMPRPPTRRPDTAGYDRPPRPRPTSSGIPVSPPHLRRAETSINTHTHAAHQNTASTPAATALGSLANVLNLKRFSRPGIRRTDSMATVGTEGDDRPTWDEFLTLPREEGKYTKFPRFAGGRKSVMERLVGKVGGSGVRPGTSGGRVGSGEEAKVKEKTSWWSWGKTQKAEENADRKNHKDADGIWRRG